MLDGLNLGRGRYRAVLTIKSECDGCNEFIWKQIKPFSQNKTTNEVITTKINGNIVKMHLAMANTSWSPGLDSFPHVW